MISSRATHGTPRSETRAAASGRTKHEVSLFNRLQFWNSADPDWRNVEVTQFSYTDYTAGTGYHSGYNVNGKFYVPGGGINATLPNVQIFDPALGGWLMGCSDSLGWLYRPKNWSNMRR